MQDLYTYPIVTTEEIRDNVTLKKKTSEYESLHRAVPDAYVDGILEDRDGNQTHCLNWLIADCKGHKFTVVTPEGYATLRVPEHGTVKITLDANQYEN